MDVYNIFPLDPSKIQWSSKIKPKWDVTKYVSAGQGRKTLTHQAYPTWQFDITFPMLSRQEVDTLLAFHMFTKGSWNPFFYKDYERHDANVTLKDGETYYYKANGLPLIIPLSVGGYTFGEPCYMADYVRVYRDGVEDTENFEVEADDSGQLRVYLTDVETEEGTLQSTVITATYEYYYRVAFQDSITVTEKFRDIYSASLTLETVKQTVTDVGDNDIWQGDNIYNVTITQNDHQLITVKKIRDGQIAGAYTSNFQIIGSYIIRVTVEASQGYVPGELYVNGAKVASGTSLNVDHDIDIWVTAAQLGSTVFMNGTKDRAPTGYGFKYYYVFYSDAACTTAINKDELVGKVIVKDQSNGLPYNGDGLVGSDNWHNQACINVTTVDVSEIDVSLKTEFAYALGRCAELREIIGLDKWNPVSATTLADFCRSNPKLTQIGDLSAWRMPSLTSLSNAFYDSAITSIDLHDWFTPNLEDVQYCFASCASLKVVDISGIDTTNVTTATKFFDGNTALQYIIMDANEVKFGGSVSMPEGNNTVKYLVPASMVAAYQAHANWSGRASRIDSIDNYIITRDNGSITVTAR